MDKRKLHAKCVERGISIAELSESIGINASTFYRRIPKNALTVGNVQDIANKLKLNSEDIIDIFFKNSVA